MIDQDVTKGGAAAMGEPWKFYDLGHGYCTYDVVDQCPPRMACARYACYRPKLSSQGQLLEVRANLPRVKQAIPLTDDECAAVDDGLAALERLCTGLADVPMPAGSAPLRPAPAWETEPPGAPDAPIRRAEPCRSHTDPEP